jgi:hypothetical protein
VTHQDEAEALAVVAARMHARFPDLPPELVDAVVAKYHGEYEGRPIRDFVPLLVERQVIEHLSGGIPEQRRPTSEVQRPGRVGVADEE